MRLLALSVADPAREHRALIIGKAPQGGGVRALAIASPGPDARRHLDDLVDLYDRAMREPLPLYAKTSAAYAAAAHRGDDGARAATVEWESTYEREREDRDAEHVRLHGGTPALRELLAAAPRADEHGPGWDPTEPTRLGRYARRLWDPLLDLEHDPTQPR